MSLASPRAVRAPVLKNTATSRTKRGPFAERRLRAERMDDPTLDPHPHRRALDGLARLNWFSRASAGLWRGVEGLLADASNPASVLDVACGGGDVSRGLARRALRAGRPLEVLGVDVSPTAVAHARAKTGSEEPVEYEALDVLSAGLPRREIVVCSLFLHHLSEEEAVALLRSMAESASVGVVVSDLRRGWVGHALALAATRLLTRSPIVWTDGPRSVEGAFTIDEFTGLAGRAGMEGIAVRPAWPQRFVAVWRKPTP